MTDRTAIDDEVDGDEAEMARLIELSGGQMAALTVAEIAWLLEHGRLLELLHSQEGETPSPAGGLTPSPLAGGLTP